MTPEEKELNLKVRSLPHTPYDPFKMYMQGIRALSEGRLSNAYIKLKRYGVILCLILCISACKSKQQRNDEKAYKLLRKAEFYSPGILETKEESIKFPPIDSAFIFDPLDSVTFVKGIISSEGDTLNIEVDISQPRDKQAPRVKGKVKFVPKERKVKTWQVKDPKQVKEKIKKDYYNRRLARNIIFGLISFFCWIILARLYSDYLNRKEKK